MKPLENKGLNGGPSGARSRDLRIKRPSFTSAKRRGFCDEREARSLSANRPAWLDEARAHLRSHYPGDGLAESVLWALYAAGFGVVGDEVLS